MFQSQDGCLQLPKAFQENRWRVLIASCTSGKRQGSRRSDLLGIGVVPEKRDIWSDISGQTGAVSVKHRGGPRQITLREFLRFLGQARGLCWNSTLNWPSRWGFLTESRIDSKSWTERFTRYLVF